MTQPKLYKKLFAFGFALFLISFPLLLVFEIESDDFVKHLNNTSSDEGVVSLFFIASFIFMFMGLIIRKLTKA